MNPVRLLVIEDAGSRAEMAGRLRGRFGEDYTVETSASAAAALERLEALHGDGVPVAMMLADVWMTPTGGIDLLAEVARHRAYGGAHRVDRAW